MQTKETISGSFRSIVGVMNPLSCFCAQGGYITMENGDEVPACFGDQTAPDSCDAITVEGYYESVTKRFPAHSPCVSGSMEIFKVETFSVG